MSSAAFAHTVPGDTLQRFVVLKRLGQGAMGVVFAAYDPKLDRRVALKLLRSELVAEVPDAARRLESEARSLARVTHPNVITVHDVGTVGTSAGHHRAGQPSA
ncbi:MAG: protein kinase domain-containing protein [Myxococcaceae bacterium]